MDPSLSAWQGGVSLADTSEFGRLAFTKAEYDERGSYSLRGDTDSARACNVHFL